MSKVRVGNRIVECTGRYTGCCKEGKTPENLQKFVENSSRNTNTSAKIKEEQQTR